MLKPVIFYIRTYSRRCRYFLHTLCLSAVLVFNPNFSFAITPDYIPLEYIEATGTQSINTGYIPTADKTRIVFETTIHNNYKIFYAGHYLEDLYQIQRMNNGKLRVYYFSDAQSLGESGGGDFNTDVFSNDHRYKVDFNKNVLSIDDTIVNTFEAKSTTVTNSIVIFPTTEGSSNTIKLYYFKIYDNDTLVQDMMPAKRKLDGTVGMYDLVSGQFFENAGTGEFIAGPELYTFLDYIESTGNQYINTGVKLADNDKTYYDVDFEITRNTNHCSLWGAYSSASDTRSGYLYVGANYLQFAVGASNDAMLTGYPTSGLAGVRHHWLLYVDDNTKERTITDVQNGSVISTSTFSGTLLKNVNLCLFGFPAGERSYLKLYSFKMTINGIVVRNFIPAKNSSNVVGMYDTVTNTFFTNSGTGTFTAGPVSIACSASLNMMGNEMCVETTAPVWPYLSAWYNGQKYYIKLSENDYPIHSGSSNKIRIITNGTTYTAHDDSVE